MFIEEDNIKYSDKGTGELIIHEKYFTQNSDNKMFTYFAYYDTMLHVNIF